MAKLYGKDLSAYDNIDLDELLSQLNEEELEQLNTDLIDPDDSCIPPAERCRYKCDKEATGKFNRKALLDFLEKKAKEEKDWEDQKPFVKELRGKKWVPKKEEKIVLNDDDAVDTEWDEVLASATEEELVDLAAILGFHGMLNQVQYHSAFVEEKDEETKAKEKAAGGGFQGVAKHQDFKLYENEPPNTTDVDDSLEKLKNNDSSLKELNLNNIKNISVERLKEFGLALKTNTNLETFSLANTKLTDRAAKAFAEGLSENKTLKSLNMESNYITGAAIVEILESICKNKTVAEFRVANQKPALLGHKIEMRIAELIEKNYCLLKFGIFLETVGPQVRVREYIQRNNDRLRQTRIGAELEPEPAYEAKEVFKKREAEKPTEAKKEETTKPVESKKEESEEEEEDSEEESSEEESDDE